MDSDEGTWEKTTSNGNGTAEESERLAKIRSMGVMEALKSVDKRESEWHTKKGKKKLEQMEDTLLVWKVYKEEIEGKR